MKSWLLALTWISVAYTHDLIPRSELVRKESFGAMLTRIQGYSNVSSTAVRTTEFSSCTWLNGSTFSAPPALSSCAVCCNQAAIKEYVFAWTSVPKIPVVVGTYTTIFSARLVYSQAP